jgi:hypothetical protein
MAKNFTTLFLTCLFNVIALSLVAQSGRVGIGESSPGSKGSIKGNLSVGSTYSSLPAPPDGAIIEGKTGIGKNNPDEQLDVAGNAKASDKVIGTRGFVAGNVSSDTGRAVFSTDITNKGFYIPRLTSAQKTTLGGILGVANKGLLVYDTVVNRMEYWDGVQWKAVGDSITKVLANNGLTKLGDTIQLGGTLIKNTTVNQSTFNMLFSGTGVFGMGATDAGSKLNVSPGNINTGVRIGDFPAASSGKTGLAIDMTNTSTSNAIDIKNIGATSMQGIRINSTANGNGTGIRIGDATTLGTGINIRGGTGIVYNALSAASGTGITIGGTTAPLNGVDAIVSGAGTGGIFQSSTVGAGVFGLSISGSYSRPSLLPLAGVRGYTATNSNSAADVAYAVHGASTRYNSTGGGTGTITYGVFGSATGNATSAGNGLMVGTYGTASVTNVGTSGAIGGLFNAASGSTNLALAASGGGDVYLGSSDADRPSNFTTGALSLGTGNTNTTRMFNTRISGTQTFVGSTSGTVGITAPASITSYSLTLPNAQGAANTVLRNDGSGNLTWATGGSLLTAGTGINITGSTINNTGAVTASNGLTLSGTDVRLGGALTAATTVSGLTATNKMSFTGTGVDAFNVDGTTFSVDATNDRVGIGTATPSQTLDVNGRVNVANGVIQRGGAAITGTSDLGLYSRDAGNWMRYVTNAAPHVWYTDDGSGGIGTTVRMQLDQSGNLSLPTSLNGTGNRNVYADANGVLKVGTTAKFIFTTYHSYNNNSYRAPNFTAETNWLPAASGDGSDDCWNCNIDFRRGWNAPYAGRLVKVIVRIQNDSGSNPDIQGIVRLNVNGTNYDGTGVISLNDSGVQTITLPASGFSFNAGDRIALGLHKRGNNSDRFEDLDIFVTAVWEYDVTD